MLCMSLYKHSCGRLRQMVSATASGVGGGRKTRKRLCRKRPRMWGKRGSGHGTPRSTHTTVGSHLGKQNAFTALVPSSLGNNSGTVPAHCYGQFIFSHGFFASFSFLFSLRLLPSLAINLSGWNHTTDIPPNIFTNQKNC